MAVAGRIIKILCVLEFSGLCVKNFPCSTSRKPCAPSFIAASTTSGLKPCPSRASAQRTPRQSRRLRRLPTDIKKIQHGTITPPRIFGHETAGTIVKIGAGSGKAGIQNRDRVALHHHVPCLDCHFCRHRAFAQCETYKRTGITARFEPAGGGYAEFVRVMPFVLPAS